jgi:hypothetical protein
MAFALTETTGLAAALVPGVWMGLFTRDPAVVAAGSAYLRVFVQLVLAGVGGSLAIHWLDGGPRALSVVIALAFALFGVTLLSAVKGGGWRTRRARA